MISTYSLKIRNNGYLTFNDISAHYTSSSFPVEYTVIAPFWADVDTRGNGSVYYRETSSASIISTVASDMSNAFPSQLPFYATSVVIATWDRVGYYDRHTDKVFKLRLYFIIAILNIDQYISMYHCN